MNKLLARILLVLALLAPAIAYTPSHDGHAATPQQDMVLFSGKVVPVASADFTKLSALTIPSWLTPSRTGNAMQWDSTGKLTYAPNNLYINSGSATSTARTITTVAGVNYYIWIQTSSGSATIVASGTNTTTFNGSAAGTWTAFTATAGTLTLTPTSNFANITQVVVAQITYETALRSGDNVVTGASAYYGPRFDYDPSTLAAKGLLIEESRTNLQTFSGTIGGTNWNIFNTLGVATNDATYTAPNGLQNFTKLTTSSTSKQAVYQAATVVNGSTYTLSAYVRAGTASWIGLENSAGATAVWFNIASGTVGTVSTGAASIESIGNSIYRIKWTAASAGVSWAFSISVPNADNTTAQTSGQTAFIFGAQMELGSFATSYIPTTSASVTRAADVVTIGGAALTALKGAAGSLIAEAQSISAVGFAANRIVGFDTGSQTPLFMNSNPTAGTYNGSVALTPTLGSSGAWASNARGAVAWNAAGRSVVGNGGTVSTDSNLISGSAWTIAYLGSNAGSSSFLNGWISKIAFYNQRLPDATLKRISNVGASFLAANDDFPRYAANDNLPITWRRAM